MKGGLSPGWTAQFLNSTTLLCIRLSSAKPSVQSVCNPASSVACFNSVSNFEYFRSKFTRAPKVQFFGGLPFGPKLAYRSTKLGESIIGFTRWLRSCSSAFVKCIAIGPQRDTSRLTGFSRFRVTCSQPSINCSRVGSSNWRHSASPIKLTKSNSASARGSRFATDRIERMLFAPLPRS